MVGSLIEDQDKGGRPRLEVTEGIKEKILTIIRENIVCYPTQIRVLYGQKYREGNLPSWSTIRKYLDQLKAEKQIIETILHKGKARTTSQVKVSEHHS
ncbi:MAG: hypothetical protein UY62_C0012G0006 [Parcubacteria group bacterium GW2011_GWF2_50_9]|nr:MAG: hypothetical protein UY62_C0012G0006 [Parcubacteria group bacterium GW2011_GWF2_50_9]